MALAQLGVLDTYEELVKAKLDDESENVREYAKFVLGQAQQTRRQVQPVA